MRHLWLVHSLSLWACAPGDKGAPAGTGGDAAAGNAVSTGGAAFSEYRVTDEGRGA